METLIGQTLGQYQIVEQIGKGGMATVYKAHQPTLNRYVAIKVLPTYYAHEEDFTARFTREAQAIAQLDHPNILPVYDFGKQGDINYIIMKYVPAGTLKNKLGSPLPPAKAVGLIEQIAAALDAAHERGILHRDVKPGNVLIDDRGWVYLSDFGLAKMVEGSVKLTGTGVGVGTPTYMSPEQGQGREVDARTDVYALGVILFEMLTGRVPYEADTPLATVIKHVTDPIPIPRQINPDIPETIERVLLRGLAKEREDRFASAGALATALKVAVEALPTPPETASLPAEWAGAMAVDQPAADDISQTRISQSDAPPPPPPATEKRGWLPWAAAIGGLLIGGIALLVGIFYFSGQGDASPSPTHIANALSASGVTPTVAPITPTVPASTDTPTGTPMVSPRPASETESRQSGDTISLEPTPQPSIPEPATSPLPATPTPPPVTANGSLIDDFEAYSVDTLESSFEINRNAGNEGRVRLVGPPHVAQGQQGLALEFDILNDPPDHYFGVDREFPAQDWSDYEALCLWLEGDGSDRSLVVQFGESKFKFWKSVTALADVGQGDYCVSLQGDHQIDLRAVGYYGVYVEGPPPGRSVIYLDEVRLSRQPPVPTATPTPPPPPTPTVRVWADTSLRPGGRYAQIWTALGEGQSDLGYPIAQPVGEMLCARQNFERGQLLWVDYPQDPDFVWAAVRPNPTATEGATSYKFTDTWPGSPEYWCDQAQANAPLGPKRGFGMLWCDYDTLRADLGQALDEEVGGPDYPRCQAQLFQGGAIIHDPFQSTYWVFIENGGWSRFGE